MQLPVDGLRLEADLAIPDGATGLVIFAHGSGSGRHSPRNRAVATTLRHEGLATLMLDLLTPDEERVDEATHALRFDVAMLAARLGVVTDWLARHGDTRHLRAGYFGASTGAAAALLAAAERPGRVGAVVSRGGRPDLARPVLGHVVAPTLLIVGGADAHVLALNEQALHALGGLKRLVVVPGATHLFEEPGALEEVARLACAWFRTHLADAPPPPATMGEPW